MTDAESIVRELVARAAADLGLTAPAEVRALSSGGANYTSALFAASVGDLKLFAKVANIGEKMRDTMNAEKLYKTEQLVYSDLAKAYTTIVDKHTARPFRFPKIYASLSDLGKETLVMEDLSAQGYRAPSRRDSIDWRFASAAVSKLAAFHALSFAFERENPEEFADKAAVLKYERPVRTPETMKALQETWGKMIGGAIQVVRDEHRPKVMELLKDAEGFHRFKMPISRTVLAHGDYRASNLMFKDLDNTIDIMVVDYQVVHAGCPVSDLLYFTFLGTDQQFRRRHHQDLLRYYHEELGAALKELGMDVEREYPREQFEAEVKQMLPLALQMAALILPLVMVEESEAPQVSGDADMQSMALAPNELFAKRYRELTEDCFEWGAL